jgi:cell division protein FtsW (lipid II flippase)
LKNVRGFEGIYRLFAQGRSINHARNQQNEAATPFLFAAIVAELSFFAGMKVCVFFIAFQVNDYELP